MGAHKPDVKAFVGQSHVDYQTDDKDDLSEAALTERLKKASGANYDLGSNAGGKASKKSPSVIDLTFFISSSVNFIFSRK